MFNVRETIRVLHKFSWWHNMVIWECSKLVRSGNICCSQLASFCRPLDKNNDLVGPKYVKLGYNCSSVEDDFICWEDLPWPLGRWSFSIRCSTYALHMYCLCSKNIWIWKKWNCACVGIEYISKGRLHEIFWAKSLQIQWYRQEIFYLDKHCA